MSKKHQGLFSPKAFIQRVKRKFPDEAWDDGELTPIHAVVVARLIAEIVFGPIVRNDHTPCFQHMQAVAKASNLTEQAIGWLHDLLEDSIWKVDDLYQLGFSEQIIQGVIRMTRIEKPLDGVTVKEPYFDLIKRCGSTVPTCNCKIRDIAHNSIPRKGYKVPDDKFLRYQVSIAYLEAIKRQKIKPDTPVINFVITDPKFKKSDKIRKFVLKHSSHNTSGQSGEATP